MAQASSGPDSIEIVQFDASKAHSYAPLFDAVWPESAPYAENVDWAFCRNPLGHGPLTAAVERETGAVVGARPSMRWPLINARGLARPICQLSGTSVHPNFRRLGLFRRMNEQFLRVAAEQGVEAVFNVSVAESRSGYEKQGWSYLPGLRRYVMVPSLLRFGAKVVLSRGQVRGLVEHMSSARSSLQAVQDAEVAAKITEAREGVVAGYHHTDYRRYDFLRWRYSRRDRSFGDVLDPSAFWCSYARMRRQRIREIFLGDLWLAEPDRKLARAMLAAIVAKEHPDLITIIMTEAHPYARVLQRAGFWPDPKGDLNFGFRIILGDPTDYLDSSRWALTSADIDTY